MTWIIFSGENGINTIFDDDLNKGKKHKRDDALVPFKTKNDMNKYEDFSGVVGAFSRLMSNTVLKNGVNRDKLYENMRLKLVDCTDEDFEILFHIIENMFFENGKLLPVNAKAFSYIDCNISQKQVAEYLYSLFVLPTDLKKKYKSMADSEDTNILENLVFDTLEDHENKDKIIVQNADCFLPYVQEVFYKDFTILTRNTDNYKSYINRFLAYYYMFYVSQLAVKLGRFERGNRNELEKVYMTLNWEVVTRVRPGYEYGWKFVKDKISHMFTHSVLLEMLSHNIENAHMDYIGFYDRFHGDIDDEQVAEEISIICNKYMNWIQMDYSGCKHDSDKDGECKASNAIRRLFEIIDYQFINGGRTSHYKGYNTKFIEFVQKNFGKWRGTSGYTVGLNESDIIMFTQIILQENDGKMRLSKLFDEFEIRGLIFDRESKKKITDLFEKMNLLEKRSDSGDAQYVKCVL